MKAFTEQLTQFLAVVGMIPASNHTNNTDTSIAGIDMSRFRRVIAELNQGLIGTNVQLTFYSSANANMSGTTNLGNNSTLFATTLPVLTSTTNNRVSTLEVRADQLPAGHRYLQPVMIVNTSAANVALTVYGADSEYSPGNQFVTANTVDQQVVGL